MFARRTAWQLAQNRYSTALHKARSRGAKLLDLTASNPTQCSFEFDSAAILGSLTHPDSLTYDPQPQGLCSAREAVVDYYKRGRVGELAQLISPEQIFLTTSTGEGYSYLFRLLCDPGDEVLVPRPSYPLFEFLAGIQDVHLRSYDLFYDHGWHIDVEGLAKSVNGRTRAVLIVNPNNPTGSFVHRAELEQIALLGSQHGLALISDEVFLDYEVEACAECSAAFSDVCLSFALSGLSKISCLPQMKLAWIVVSGPERATSEARQRLEVIADTYLSVNAPIQYALPHLLGLGPAIQSQLISRVRQNVRSLDEQLGSTASVQRLKIDGGWYAVLRVPATRPDEDLAIDLIEHAGVVVHPGHFYDFPRDGYMVVSLITPEHEFREAISRIREQIS